MRKKGVIKVLVERLKLNDNSLEMNARLLSTFSNLFTKNKDNQKQFLDDGGVDCLIDILTSELYEQDVKIIASTTLWSSSLHHRFDFTFFFLFLLSIISFFFLFSIISFFFSYFFFYFFFPSSFLYLFLLSSIYFFFIFYYLFIYYYFFIFLILFLFFCYFFYFISLLSYFNSF